MAVNGYNPKVNILTMVDRDYFEPNKVVSGECILPKNEKC